MAKLVEIVAIERERETDDSRRQIHLFADGSFYRAYEWSAWLCCSYVNKFKVTKRYNKSIETDLVFVGFPKTSLQKFLPEGTSIEEKEDGRIIMTLPETLFQPQPESEQEYTNWRSTIPMAEPKQKPLPTLANRPVSVTGIMKKVMEYNVLEHSPIECMQFVSDIQRQLAELL